LYNQSLSHHHAAATNYSQSKLLNYLVETHKIEALLQKNHKIEALLQKNAKGGN